MNITKCQGEGQSSCKRCNDRGKWNRMWLCFLYCIEGMEGIYCSDCVEEIEKEEMQIEEMAMLISGNEIQHRGHRDIAERLYNAGYRKQEWISVEELQKAYLQYEETTGIKKAKADAAKEIFDELEREIEDALKNNYDALRRFEDSDVLWHSVNGKINTLRGLEHFIAELKKKYTEGDDKS